MSFVSSICYRVFDSVPPVENVIEAVIPWALTADCALFDRYKEPQSAKIPELEQELVRSEAQSLVAEAQLTNVVRSPLPT